MVGVITYMPLSLRFCISKAKMTGPHVIGRLTIKGRKHQVLSAAPAPQRVPDQGSAAVLSGFRVIISLTPLLLPSVAYAEGGPHPPERCLLDLELDLSITRQQV